MDIIVRWLPWGDKAFPFHSPANLGEASGHKSEVEVVVA